MPNQDGLRFLFDIQDKISAKLAKIEAKSTASAAKIDKAFTRVSKTQEANSAKAVASEQRRIIAVEKSHARAVALLKRESDSRARTLQRSSAASASHTAKSVANEQRRVVAVEKAHTKAVALLKRESDARARSTAKAVSLVNRESAARARATAKAVSNEQKRLVAVEKSHAKAVTLLKRESAEFKRSMGRMAAAASVAFAVVVGKALQMAGGYDAAMRSVQAKTGATGDLMDRLSEQSREMGRTTVHSATEAARGQAFLAQAGFDANEVLEALPATLALATAGELDLASAADIASNVLSGFRLETDQTARVADVLALAASKTNTSVSQLGAALAKAAPSAAAAQWSLEEVTAAIGKLSDAGIQGEEAGTALKTMMAKLAIDGGPAERLMAKMGITVKDTAGQMLPLNDILMALAPHANNVGLQMELLGTRGGNAGLVLGAVAQDARALTGELENADGAAQRMADIMSGGLWGSLKAIASIVDSAYISLGQRFAPALQKVADLFAKLPSPIQEVVVVVGSLAAAMGGLMVMMPGAFGALTNLPNKIGQVTVAFRALNLTMLANPFVLIASGLALAGVALYTFREQLGFTRASTYETEGSLEDAEQKVADLERQVDSASRRSLPKFQRALRKAREELERWESPIEKARQEVARLEGKLAGAGRNLGRFQRDVDDARAELERLIQAEEAAVVSTDDLADAQVAAAAVAEDAAAAAAATAAAIEAVATAADKAASEYRATMNWVGEQEIKSYGERAKAAEQAAAQALAQKDKNALLYLKREEALWKDGLAQEKAAWKMASDARNAEGLAIMQADAAKLATGWNITFFDNMAQSFAGGGGFIGGLQATMTQGWSSLFLQEGETQATGFLGKMQGIMGKLGGVPLVGPLLAAFGPALIAGLGKLAGKVWSKIKSLFGGPSKAEQEGRDMFAAFHAGLSPELKKTEAYTSEVQAAIAAGWDRTLAETAVAFKKTAIAAGLSGEAGFEAYTQYQNAVADGNTELMMKLEAQYAEWERMAAETADKNTAASADSTEAIVHDADEIGRQFKGLTTEEAAKLGAALLDLGNKANQGFTQIHNSAIATGNALANNLLPRLYAVRDVLSSLPSIKIGVGGGGGGGSSYNKAAAGFGHLTDKEDYLRRNPGDEHRWEDARARARGGPVGAGRPYMVGERGPELFVPSRSGRIEPHGSSGGGVDAKALAKAVADALQGTRVDVDGRQLGRLVVRHQPLAAAELGGRR